MIDQRNTIIATLLLLLFYEASSQEEVVQCIDPAVASCAGKCGSPYPTALCGGQRCFCDRGALIEGDGCADVEACDFDQCRDSDPGLCSGHGVDWSCNDEIFLNNSFGGLLVI